MAKVLTKTHRTWIEIDSRAAKKNYDTFRKLIGPVRPLRQAQGIKAQGKRGTQLWSVVKSNAYGHGIVVFSKLADRLGVNGFCVDSLVEGIRLRKEGIKKPILVLGPTLPALLHEAAKRKITITISNFDSLKVLTSIVAKKATIDGVPEFHLKIDTGMHRQGFYLADLPKVLKSLNSKSSILNSRLRGIYTHFASAKDTNYPTYTEKQFAEFQKAIKLFEDAGFPAEGGSASGGKNSITVHCAATGGTLVNPKYHLDAVRVGIGLYGLWPSKELEVQLGRKIKLYPVLSWRAVVSEVKNLEAGDYIGYDLVERAPRPMKMAVIPVGYWHGLPRSLSGIGEVLINGRRAKILGRISMDLIAVGPVTGVKPGDIATFIGKDGKENFLAFDVAARGGTIHYELLTRLNPLIERIIQ
ncbi:MAG: alanine racemase [Patescibacteria group bacterium]